MASTPITAFVKIASADGVMIPAIETRPANEATAYLLMLHGITTHKDEFGGFYRNVADSLAQRSIASLRIDFRGHGDSSEPSRSFSVASQVLDTLSAAEWFRRKSGGRRVHLLGCSFGAPPAIYLCGLRPSLIGTLNLVCPVLDYAATFLKPTTEWASGIFNEESLRNAFATGALWMNDSFSIDVKLLIEMYCLRPYKGLQEINTPTLIIHGEADSMVPFAISKRHTKGLDHVALLGVPGMDHGYTDQDDETGDTAPSQRNYNYIVDQLCSNVGKVS